MLFCEQLKSVYTLTIIVNTSSLISSVLFQSPHDFFWNGRRGRKMITLGDVSIFISCVPVKYIKPKISTMTILN